MVAKVNTNKVYNELMMEWIQVAPYYWVSCLVLQHLKFRVNKQHK